MRGSSIILDIVIDMNDAKRRTLAQLEAFVQGSAGVEFGPAEDDHTGYSRAQLARLIERA